MNDRKWYVYALLFLGGMLIARVIGLLVMGAN